MRRITALAMGAVLTLSMVSTAFAATDTENANTTLEVTSAITLTGLPATIDFGSGVPGDNAPAPAFTLNVLTNNSAGYDLSFKASDMTGTAESEVIAATEIEIGAVEQGLGTGSASTAIVAADTYQDIATSAAHSDAAGDDFLTTVQITAIPFVASDTYTGTAAAEASTL